MTAVQSGMEQVGGLSQAGGLSQTGSLSGSLDMAETTLSQSGGLSQTGSLSQTGGLWSALGMLAVTVLILVAAWAVTRWLAVHANMPGGGPRYGGGERFRVLAQLSLGRSERLVLVRFQDRCLLLGVTEHQMTLLRELEYDEAQFQEEGTVPGFMEVLSETLRRRK